MVENPCRKVDLETQQKSVKCAACGCGGEQRYQCSSTVSLAIQEGQRGDFYWLVASLKEHPSTFMKKKQNCIFPLTRDHWEHQAEEGTDAHTRTTHPLVHMLQQTELNMGKLEAFCLCGTGNLKSSWVQGSFLPKWGGKEEQTMHLKTCLSL